MTTQRPKIVFLALLLMLGLIFCLSEPSAVVTADFPESQGEFAQLSPTATPEPTTTPEPPPAPISATSDEPTAAPPSTEASPEPTPTPSDMETPPAAIPALTSDVGLPVEAAGSEASDHIVQAGEILWNIAREYNTTAEAIMEANGVTDPRGLQIGQKLLILSGDASGSLAAPIKPMSVYEIKQGDTLAALADEYGITLVSLQAANPGLEPTRLQIGEQLLIPSPDETHRAARKSIEYIIQPGDTLLALAIQYGSDVDSILAANPGLAPTRLQIGQEVTLPLDGSGGAAVRSNGPAASQRHGADVVAANITSLEEGMVGAINAQRSAQGLAAYTMDETLTGVAESHAYDMVSRGYFSHVTPEGETLRGRLQDAGLEVHWVGENIQRNTQPADRTVETAISWFMGSRPHRSNILHGHYNHVGVGVVEGPPGWYTFVLVFAER